MKKKFVHVVEILESVGGTSNKIYYLSTEMIKDYDVYIICLKKSKMTSKFSELGVSVIEIDNVGIKGFFSLLKIINHIKPDIVMSHFTRNLIYVYISNVLFKFDHIHHEHGPATLKPKTLSRKIERFILNRNIKFVVNSNYTKETYINEYKLFNSNISLAYNPVFSRGEFCPRLNFSNINILHIGGMIKERNQIDIINSANELCKRLVNVNVNVYLIGDGPERKNLEQLAVNSEAKIYFEGYQDDISKYYDICQFYVNSTTFEGFGIATAEAMLAGKIVIVADKSANVELIENYFNGFYYMSNDFNSLTDSIIHCLNLDHDSLYAICTNAKNKVVNNYNAYNYYKNINDICGE